MYHYSPKRRRLAADHSNVLSDMFHRTRASSYTIDLSLRPGNVICIIGNLVVFQPGSCHPVIHGGPGRVSQILTMFQFHPVVPIYLVSRDMTTIAIVGFVDPAAGSFEKTTSRRELRCRAWLLPAYLNIGRSAPQRFGDHSLVDFATPRYRTLPVDRAQQVLGQATREILLEHSADGTSRNCRGIVAARPTLSRRVRVRCAVSVLQCRKRGGANRRQRRPDVPCPCTCTWE
jgi:hypothetical protein